MEHVVSRLLAVKETIDGLIARLNIAAREREIATIERQAGAPDFWDEPEAASRQMQTLAALKDEAGRWRSLAQRSDDALELAQMEDDELLPELEAETAALEPLVARMAFEALLSGPHDSEDAILAIHAGAGGTDSQDWAGMLERMYLRWAEQNGYRVSMLERSEGEEAGVKSVMFAVAGPYAYGYLHSELGVHRLGRLSPFDSASRRHTSFAKVELWPDIQGAIDIELNDADLRIDAYRAGGAGGQHVQKNDTAIRITHLPTGIVVQCQNERSQKQNRERALQILRARLHEEERLKQEAELARLKGENVDAGWGNQIRSYVLHPYQMVKDHRTSHEVGNAGAVLDGQLNDFMEAWLRVKVAGAANA